MSLVDTYNISYGTGNVEFDYTRCWCQVLPLLIIKEMEER